jgi:hypothetical protein
MNKKIPSLLILLALASTTSVALAQTMPGLIPVSGTLTDSNGALLTGAHNITVSVHVDAGGDAAALFEQTTSVEGSTLDLMLNPNAALAAAIASGEARFIELEIDGEVLTPRIQLGAVPYATRAASADVAANANTLGGKRPADFVEAASLPASLGSALTAALSAKSPLMLNEEGGKFTFSLAPCAEPGAVWRSIAGQWACRLIERYVGSSSVEVNAIPGSMSDLAISIKDGGIEDRHIKRFELKNWHIASDAQLEPSKIANTAAVLNGTAVQNFKNNTLVVEQGRVAIGKASAAANTTLDVAGNARLDNLTVSSITRTTPALVSVEIGPEQFFPARNVVNGTNWVLHEDGYAYLGTQNGSTDTRGVLIATLNLPDDATMHEFRCRYQRASGILNGSIAFVTGSRSSLSTVPYISTIMAPNATDVRLDIRSLTGITVGPNDRAFLRLDWDPDTHGNQAKFLGCTVRYFKSSL